MTLKTNILIVDDSRIFRSLVEESLANENDIKVIGSVRNGVKAIEFIKSKRPDIVTLDLEMPDMDGLETLEAIQENNALNKDKKPIGVIMLSAFTHKGADITIKALEAGAFDFITKPEEKSAQESLNILHRQLVMKIRYFTSRQIASGIRKKPLQGNIKPGKIKSVKPAALKNINPNNINPVLEKEILPDIPCSGIKAILIGVSTGGPRALIEIMPRICSQTNLPIYIVQHMPPTFTTSLAGSLDSRCSHFVTEGKHNTRAEQKCAYVAPGGRHMLLRKQGTNIYIVINDNPPESGCRPSVNVLFRSALSAYGGDVLAIILTGMGNDGTDGVKALKRAGAYVIVQDEATSVVWGMPGSAYASGCVDRVVPLHDIPETVFSLLNNTQIK